jgi:hypothetical protein
VVTIPLVPRTARAIGLAIGERTEGPVFLAADGRRLDRHAAGRIVRRTARSSGIGKLVTPHTLRHAFITAALDAGVPLRDVQDAASHADPRTTMRVTGPAATWTGTRPISWPPTWQAPPGNQAACILPGGERPPGRTCPGPAPGDDRAARWIRDRRARLERAWRAGDVQGQTWLVAFEVPAAVERLLTVDVAKEIARTFGDQIVYPQRIVADCPAGSSPAPGFSRRFPGWPGPVLVLSDENQGVCSWGVPSGGSEVVVGGDLLDAGRATMVYAASVADFIAARRWDHRCLNTGPVLQAQAAELDQASLGYLQAELIPAVPTAGWPGSRQYRFEGRGVQVMLWSQVGQCDWWVSASSDAPLRQFTAGLLDLPGLDQALWSNDEEGERLLSEARRLSR